MTQSAKPSTATSQRWQPTVDEWAVVLSLAIALLVKLGWLHAIQW
jgi:hypothetical protein